MIPAGSPQALASATKERAELWAGCSMRTSKEVWGLRRTCCRFPVKHLSFKRGIERRGTLERKMLSAGQGEGILYLPSLAGGSDCSRAIRYLHISLEL